MAQLDFTVADIPEHAVRIAAMAAIELTESILRQPGGREMLDAETARRKAAKAASQKQKGADFCESNRNCAEGG